MTTLQCIITTMPYSHSDTIEAFTKFYAFLTTLPYIPASALQHPPPNGWPSITDDAFSPLGKTPEVLHLLRHLPYLEDVDWNIAYDTKVTAYNSGRARDCLQQGQSLEVHGLKPFHIDDIPPHAVTLTNGSNYGSWLICNTIDGTLTEHIPLGTPGFDNRPWYQYPTMPIVQFLEQWKERYTELEWVATPGAPGAYGNIAIPGETNDRDLAETRDIYRAHGWPSNFYRDDCHKALVERAQTLKEALLQQGIQDIEERPRRKAAAALQQAET
ncbi:hypothetical protein XPA_005384 [Xanthoria parietina]